MHKPSLLLNISDRNLEETVCENRALKNYFVHRVSGNTCWIDELTRLRVDVGLIQADDFSLDIYEKLVASNLLKKMDIIFLSNGKPNNSIDKAMCHGASYHLKSPLDLNFIEELLNEIHFEIVAGDEYARSYVSSELDQFGMLVGSSVVMRKLNRVIRKAADSKASVFIVGESGVGKELVANTIHLMGPRSDQPFVAVNCGALNPELIESELFGHVQGAFTGANKNRAGVFEQAKDGTLFLDEVMEMPVKQQVKLLRVLETGEYRPVGSDTVKTARARIISATNREPSDIIKEGLFREDLYFRLAHFPIRVPPLRDRGSDVAGLAKHFLAYRNAEEKSAKTISPAALEKICGHGWPGNVRELKHAIERAYILADNTIIESHLIIGSTTKAAPPRHTTLPAGVPLDEVEKGVILKTLAKNSGNKSTTAAQLGISLKTLYNKLEKYKNQQSGQVN